MSSLIRPTIPSGRFPQGASTAPLSVLDDGATQATFLFQAAGIGDGDHVVVIGRKTLDHLIALNRLNCRSVTALHPDRSVPAIDAADVVWVTATAQGDSGLLLPLVQHPRKPRAIAIELADLDAGCRLPTLLEDLRFEGFVQVASRLLTGRRMVIASRPDWLRRIV